MKTILLLSSLSLLTSCGVMEGLSKNCGSDIKMGCNAIFGMKNNDQDAQIAQLTFKNNEQDARLDSLEKSTNAIIENINYITLDIENLEDVDNANATIIANLQATVTSNVTQILSLSNTVTTLSGNLTTIQNTVTALDSELSKTVVSFKDPCGDGTGYDEILMKTRDGKFIAYFEAGGDRFLSILGNGSYRTTDQSKCYFTVNNGVVTNEHY